jgi:endonuclease G
VPAQRDLTRTYDDVYVFSGPLYMPARGPNGKWIVQYEMLGDDKGGQVAVPTHFFKVILAERRGGLAVGAFIMPNKPIPPDIALERFTVDLAAVERASVSTKQLHLIRAALDTCIAIQNALGMLLRV